MPTLLIVFAIGIAALLSGSGADREATRAPTVRTTAPTAAMKRYGPFVDGKLIIRAAGRRTRVLRCAHVKSAKAASLTDPSVTCLSLADALDRGLLAAFVIETDGLGPVAPTAVWIVGRVENQKVDLHFPVRGSGTRAARYQDLRAVLNVLP
jgi:hypothetical protein